MTLDEAIEERLKVIKLQEKLYEECCSDASKEIIKSATDNDRQFVEWLTELKSKQWISCKDKMPDDNELVLFCYVGESGKKSVHYGYHQTVRGLGSSWGKISGGWRYCNDDVTHWMPLPEPPKDGDKE